MPSPAKKILLRVAKLDADRDDESRTKVIATKTKDALYGRARATKTGRGRSRFAPPSQPR